MEKVKIYNNNEISIKSLIGSANEILNKYDNNEDKIIDPYVQLADNTVDANTGYKLKDIWRYFRYTWSIPYKNTPGRNLYYLVRDRAQSFHPIIGIFALGNCILNLTVRDNEIGWTLDAINNNMKRKSKSSLIECSISSKAKSVLNTTEYLESPEEYESRIQTYSKELIENFINSINGAISEIYVEDLHEFDFNKIKLEDIVKLREIASELKNTLLDTPHLDENTSDYRIEAQTPLYKKKRCLELSKLYDAKLIFEKYNKGTSVEVLKKLLKSADGIRAINVALVANRKTKIGSNMMEIIVCGSIPPYNELLGGKLVSILACSPKIIEDYKTKYANQVSEIASRMAGRKIVRDRFFY